jgi:hypothetical protein
MPGDRDEDAELHPPGAAAARFTSPFGVPLMVKNFDRVAKKHGRDFGKGLGLFAGGMIPARAKVATFGGELVTDPISGRDHVQVKQGLYRPRPDKITAASAAWLANTNKSGYSANCRIVVQNRNPFSATLVTTTRVQAGTELLVPYGRAYYNGASKASTLASMGKKADMPGGKRGRGRPCSKKITRRERLAERRSTRVEREQGESRERS